MFTCAVLHLPQGDLAFAHCLHSSTLPLRRSRRRSCPRRPPAALLSNLSQPLLAVLGTTATKTRRRMVGQLVTVVLCRAQQAVKGTLFRYRIGCTDGIRTESCKNFASRPDLCCSFAMYCNDGSSSSSSNPRSHTCSSPSSDRTCACSRSRTILL